jgi:hypothetical protein
MANVTYGELKVELLPNSIDPNGCPGTNFELTAPLGVTVRDVDGITALYSVPVGFVTDFASVPQLFQNIFPREGSYTVASAFHDYCYATACVTRKEADDIFLQGMKDLGTSFFVRYSIYLGVRIGGASHYGRNK